jgi:nucleoside-diphosphate-sugar epimerase
MDKVALWGASGAIGRTVAEAFRAQNRPYRVVGRNRETLEREFGSDPLAEIVLWNPEDPESVRAAASGVAAIVYLVGVDYWRFDLHPKLMRATLDGAIAAGVDRMLLVATIYPYGPRRGPNPVREDHPREPNSVKGGRRKEQEDMLLEADRAGKIRGCVLRLPDFYGPGVEKSFLHGLFVAGATGTTGNLIGPIDAQHEFVFVPDVGPVVANLVDDPRAYGRVLHLGGAGATTERAIVQIVEQQTGRRVKTLVANATMLRMIGLFNPMMRELVEMHYLMTEPFVLDDSALAGLIGPIHKTSYEDGVRACLAAIKASSPQAA